MSRRDAPVLEAMHELAGQYPRYGYQPIQVFLERRGLKIGVDRTDRLWRLAKLQVPRKRPRRRLAIGRPRPFAPAQSRRGRAYDFLFNSYGNGQ